MIERKVLIEILDIAKWAPSGDNTQPWRFEIVSGEQITVHGFDTKEWCVYDLDSWASQVAHGALLENIRLAATKFGLQANWQKRNNSMIYDVYFKEAFSINVDPLVEFIESRTVQRRVLKNIPLNSEEKTKLINCLPEGVTVEWIDKLKDRINFSKILFEHACIRMESPESYQVHKKIIDWENKKYSPDKVPTGAIAINFLSLVLVKWVMKSWTRVKFFNRYLLGHILPSIEIDFIPGVFCASHFILKSNDQENALECGISLQRFWLTCTQMGIQLQPEITPLIMSRYYNKKLQYSKDINVMKKSEKATKRFNSFLTNTEKIVYMGRLGHGKTAKSRSVRLSLKELCINYDIIFDEKFLHTKTRNY